MIDNIINDYIHLHGWYFTVLTGLFGGFIGLCWYAIRSYFNASREFRNAIYTELEGFYPTPVKWPKRLLDIDPILREKYSRIEIAVHNFKGHLPTCLVKRFKKAWIKYYSANGDECCQCYDHYIPFSGTSIENGKEIKNDNTKTYKETFKHNIDNLLKYVK